jgi:predicted XRE-type DNA-binding protein
MEVQTFESVWGAVADTPGLPANLRVRADIMTQLVAIIGSSGWKEADATAPCSTRANAHKS